MLNRVAQLSIPMVGVDPALVLCYRDEYREILGDKRGNFKVQLVHEWLNQLVSEPIEICEDAENGIFLVIVLSQRHYRKVCNSGKRYSNVMVNHLKW